MYISDVCCNSGHLLVNFFNLAKIDKANFQTSANYGKVFVTRALAMLFLLSKIMVINCHKLQIMSHCKWQKINFCQSIKNGLKVGRGERVKNNEKNNLVVEVNNNGSFQAFKTYYQMVHFIFIPYRWDCFVFILARNAQILTPLTSGEFNNCVNKCLNF